jgi:hypothetical protein
MAVSDAGRSISGLTRRSYFVLRVGLAALGCAAIVWGSFFFVISWPQATVERAAARIIDAETYRLSDLKHLRSMAMEMQDTGPCRPLIARSAAIIQLRLAEIETAQPQPGEPEKELEQARAQIARSLACSPADPFLLMSLFWLNTLQFGFNSADLDLLRLSYRLGPNEGWVGLRRFSLALAVIKQLPPELVRAMVDDFVNLVGAAIYPQMVDRFIPADLATRKMLLSALDRLSDFHRRNFAAYMKSSGIETPAFEGEKREPRPWQ